jgi:hypothetical protein
MGIYWASRLPQKGGYHTGIPVKARVARFGKFKHLALILTLGIGAFATGESKAGSMNDVFAGIAMRVPEFAGMHVDPEHDVLYVHLRNGNPGKAHAVAAELRTAFGSHRFQQTRVEVLPATFSFSELKQWHDSVSMNVLPQSGVVFSGIDHAENRLVIGLENSKVRSLVEHQLAGLGLPREAVSFMETGRVELLQKTSLNEFNRPLVGGLEIARNIPGPEAPVCTLGFIAKRAGILGFVTASHCSRREGAVDDKVEDAYGQPRPDPFYPIGVEKVDPPFRGCHCLFFGHLCLNSCRQSDSAFIALDPNVKADQGAIARSDSWESDSVYQVSTKWDGSRFEITGETYPTIGDDVTKVGRTTGRTDGHMLFYADFNVDLPWLLPPLSDVPPGTRILKDQGVTTLSSDHGDSGAPIIGGTSLAGILWGSLGGVGPFSLSVFSPIGGVQADLGRLTFVTNPNADLVAASPPGSVQFCKQVGDQRRIVIRVENLGGAFAPASITRVDIAPFASFDIPVIGIPPGGFRDLDPIALPSGCGPDCDFSITVDRYDSVDEGPAGEANNTAFGGCVG